MHAACVLSIDRDDFKHSDVAAQYAGDEFFVTLLGANLADGRRIADEIETSLEALRFNEVQAHERVRANIGVVHALPGESVWDTLHRANLEAYRIKTERGRSTRA